MAYSRNVEKRGVAEAAVDYMADEGPALEDQHEFLSLLGLRSFDTVSLLKRLDEGLSYAAFERLKRHLDVTSRELADAALINPRTLARRKNAGRFGPGESDRLVRLARVFSRAIQMYGGNQGSAREWMMRPNRALGRVSPFEMAKTEVGANEVENLITRIEYGVFS